MIYPVPKPIRVKKESKNQEWDRIREELKKEFARAGIVTCEIKLPGCTKSYLLGFAHTRKRRNVTDLKRVVLGCSSCHSLAEYDCLRQTGMKMEEFLELIINARKVQP